MPRNYKYYNPLKFNVNAYSPALWLDASDPSTLIMDGARTFNGSSQYLSVSNNSTHAPADNLMVGCWVKMTALPGLAQNMRLVSRWLTTGNQRSYDLVLQNVGGIVNFTFLGSSAGSALTGQAINTLVPTTGTWYFVVGWWSGGNLYCSVNAGTPATAVCAALFNSTAALLLGAREGGADYLNGSMDSSFLFKAPSSLGNGTAGSLAKTLIDYLYNSGSGRRSSDFISSAYYSSSGAVSWWDMDARSGNETDRIGSNNPTDNGGVGYAAGIASGLVQYTGDPVKQWSDKSGNARHVTATADSRRPTYTTGAKNGLPGLLFDGTDDGLALASDLVLSEYTFFAVWKNSDATNGSTLMTKASDSYNYHAVTPTAVAHQPGSPTVLSTYSVATADEEWCLSQAVRSGTTLQIGKNGILDVGRTSSIAYTYSVVGGAYNGGANFTLDGVVLEILLYPTALATAQRQNVERYLGNKWGISVP